ncbi:BTAD domain-containing putative transcriptional regulator [Micromonospora profundi]|uniref:AfsR/SARP family transcriptional regulator n=1 Tax=Micromonospora profundi TaxID=1420889 RepID=UPI0033BA8171
MRPRSSEVVGIEVLGAARVLRDGVPVELSCWWVRDVLALLALSVNRHVSTDRMARGVWDRDLDAAAAAKIERAIRELDLALRIPGDDATRIERSAGGRCVRLVAPAGGTDLLVVEHLHEQAQDAAGRGDLQAAAEWSGEALRLWDGATAVPTPRTAADWPETVALRELRALIEHDHHRWALAAGADPGGRIRRLQDLAAAHPMDESWCALEIAALAAAGDRPEAEIAYHRIADRLSSTWGLEPGPPGCGRSGDGWSRPGS